MQNLPSAVQTICETWNSIHTNEFPNIGSWVCEQQHRLLSNSQHWPDDHNIPDAHTMLNMNMTVILTLNTALCDVSCVLYLLQLDLIKISYFKQFNKYKGNQNINKK